jgi:Secretion system C-terminal sorting domain
MLVKKIAAFLIFAAFCSGLAEAQMATGAFRLYVTKVEANGDVTLSWEKPKDSPVDRYFIYRAKMPDSTSVMLVDSTKDTSATTVIPISMGPSVTYVFTVVARNGWTVYLKSSPVFVTMPGIPVIGGFRLTAKYESSTGKTTLTWTNPPLLTPIMPSMFYLYRSAFPDTSSFSLIDSTKNMGLTDTPPAFPGLTKIYVYYVKAAFPTGTTLYSTTALISVTGRSLSDTLRFTSVPPSSALVGVTLSYQPKVVSSNPAAIVTFSLDHHPEGMTINAVSGLLSWKPLHLDWVDVKVIARSNIGGTATQEFSIVVTSGNGVIEGIVTDTTGKPLFPVMIEAFKRDAGASFHYVGYTNQLGIFHINRLDPGDYAVEATPLIPNMMGQWWVDPSDPTKPGVVHVRDSASSITKVNFMLRYREAAVPKVFIVKGKVTDSLGIAVTAKGTRVILVRAEFALNSGNLPNNSVTIDDFKKYFEFDSTIDFRIEGNSRHVFKAFVDSATGQYSLTVPLGNYIALARSPGYSSEFYRGQQDLFSANIIYLRADSLNIDFTLAPLPPVLLGEISGSVIDTVNDVRVRSRVMAFRDHWGFRDLYPVSKKYLTDTDSLGHYTLSDLLPGWYVVFAYPVGNYEPAFYNSGVQGIGWQKATRLYINGNSISDINIYSHPRNRTNGGLTAIGGHVGAKPSAGGMMPGTKETDVAGALVYALDATSDIAGYGISDASGNYLIGGLAPGSYTVTLDKPGYTTPGNVTTSPTYGMMGNAIISTVSFTLNAVTAIAAQTTSVPDQFTLEQNYPNPFNPSTSIRYALPNAGLVTLKIYNVIGQEVATLVNDVLPAGSYQVTFNAAQFASGVYFYRLQSGATVETKKMLLVK